MNYIIGLESKTSGKRVDLISKNYRFGRIVEDVITQERLKRAEPNGRIIVKNDKELNNRFNKWIEGGFRQVTCEDMYGKDWNKI